jgi:hypothetical protein
MFRTPALWRLLLRAAAELIDECRAIVARGGFGHIERHDDSLVRVRVDYVMNDRVVRPRLLSELGAMQVRIYRTSARVFLSSSLPTPRPTKTGLSRFFKCGRTRTPAKAVCHVSATEA